MVNLKKINNKFIIWVVTLIILIIAVQINLNNTIDRNSYVTLVNGAAYLNDIELDIDNREILSIWDTIKTWEEDSLVVIEWGDGSITRVWWESELKVKENMVANNLSKVQISFELIRWKTWSNVISFMWEESYFTEYYADSEAWVRGTIFEFNAEKGYIYVDKHEVNFINSKGEKQIIPEKKPFNISDFSFIEFQKFMEEFQDLLWKDINKKLDEQLFERLRQELLKINNTQDGLLRASKNLLNKLEKNNTSEDIDDIVSNLNVDEKNKLYEDLLEKYQKFNFIDPEDNELYAEKLLYKKALLTLWSEKNKKNLIDTTIYDLKDLVKTKDKPNLKPTLDLFTIDKNLIKDIDFSFMEELDFDFIPEGLKNEFENIMNIQDFIVDEVKGNIEKTIIDWTKVINNLTK